MKDADKSKGKLIFLTVCLVALSVLMITTGIKLISTEKGYNEINLSQLEEMLDKEETFVLEVASTTCGACIKFKPTLEKVVDKNDVVINVIYLDKLSEEDREEFYTIMNISGTPTLSFFNGGVESTAYRLTGVQDYDTVVKTLTNLKYIEKK